jgi:hypothetical protein
VRRVIVPAVLAWLLAALTGGCNRPSEATQLAAAPAVAPPAVPAAPPVQSLTADRLAGKTFIYNHSLVDGGLEGASVVLAADGKVTGADDQPRWKLDAGVLVFLDANGGVRTRFDKAYAGKAGLFFLGHRTSDNRYHTLLELPPTR